MISRVVAILLLLCCAASAQLGQAPGWMPIQVPAAGPTIYAGSFNDQSGFLYATGNLNIGTATATRVVVVGFASASSGRTYAATVAGVTVPQLVVDGGSYAYFFGGVVNTGSGSQAITVTCASGCGYESRDVFVWVLDGLSSTSVNQTASSDGTTTATISVSAGDFLFVINALSDGTCHTWNGSTQAPTADVGTPSGSAFVDCGAYWDTITATNASFSVISSGNVKQAIVSYH
jgi:hypothetical protein